jgi:hypothetical protein
MSSGDHFSRRIGSGFSGKNTSSIRFARDMMGIIFSVFAAFFMAATA